MTKNSSSFFKEICKKKQLKPLFFSIIKQSFKTDYDTKDIIMKSEEKILTRHPQGKNGVHILKRRYDIIYSYIFDTLQKEKEITYKELSDRSVQDLSNSFDGKVGWYVVTVKLDMEARGVIERIPGSKPHKVRISKKEK